MQNMNYSDVLCDVMPALEKGRALLTVGGETPNTMTIGWGSVGRCWNKNVLTVYVRPQRHTHDILMQQGQFTVSFNISDSADMSIFRYAGTASGRDEDKFAGHGLTALPAQTVDGPIVAECQLHFECRLLASAPMIGETMDGEVRRRQYPLEDYHTIYMGEILACYRTDLPKEDVHG